MALNNLKRVDMPLNKETNHQIYGFKYSYQIEIMCIQLYGFKYSYQYK